MLAISARYVFTLPQCTPHFLFLCETDVRMWDELPDVALLLFLCAVTISRRHFEGDTDHRDTDRSIYRPGGLMW